MGATTTATTDLMATGLDAVRKFLLMQYPYEFEVRVQRRRAGLGWGVVVCEMSE